MTMKNYILEEFSLALLSQLNAYSIITRGGKGWVWRKNTTKTQKYSKQTNTFLQITYGGTGHSAQTSYTDQVDKSKNLPRSLILI